MNEIQTELLVLLKEFDRICRDNQIKYSLHGGTLLGAVREHGFIPWDDDIDITLRRDEFDKLTRVLKKEELKEHFYYLRLGVTRKLVLCNPDKPLVWIDLIVYDYITENPVGQKIKVYGLSCFRAFCRRTDSLEDTKRRGKFKGTRFFLICLMCYCGKLFPEDVKNGMADSFSQRLGGRKKLIHRANDQFSALLIYLPKYVMDDYIDIDLYDTKFMISKYYHEILSTAYGDDYMTPVKCEVDAESHKRSADYVRKMLREEGKL